MINEVDQIAINSRNSFGDDALLSAALSHNTNVVKYLISTNKFSWITCDAEKNSIIHIASANNDLPLLKYIIKKGPIELINWKSSFKRFGKTNSFA